MSKIIFEAEKSLQFRVTRTRNGSGAHRDKKNTYHRPSSKQSLRQLTR